MVKPKKARSFKISKLKNPSEVTRICDLLKCPAPRHHSFKLDSKLKYLNSDQLPLSKRSKLWYSKSAPINVK